MITKTVGLIWSIFFFFPSFFLSVSFRLITPNAFFVEGSSREITNEEIPILLPLSPSPNYTKVPLRFPCNNVTKFCASEFMDCRKGYCHCILGYAPNYVDECREIVYYNMDIRTDPTMIGVVIGLVLMSVTLCVVLRLFAKARFRENRTIFNTPNPRLMNVSLMKGGSKHFFRGNSSGERRGSQASVNSNSIAETTTQTRNVNPAPQTVTNSIRNDTGEDGSLTSVSVVGGGRSKGLRSQMSIESSADTPSTSSGARFPKSKYRQDSVTSNSNV